jgi:hypothetical protein
LIETLIALAILATSLSIFYPAYRGAFGSFERIDRHLAARHLAQSVLDESLISRRMREGTTQGRSGDYRWRLTIRPAPADLAPQTTPRWQLFEVAVDIEWPTNRRFSLSTYRLGRP